MAHPRKLEEAGLGGPVRLFARNKLCAIAQANVEVSEETLLEVISRSDIRLGTSTPKADPSGDYAWQLFDKAEALQAGSGSLLKEKAMQLTGGPDSEKPPEGRNHYAWVMDTDKADVFLTYCTNAVLAQREVPTLQIIRIPPELAVGADYGLTVLQGAPTEANALANFILGEEGQNILAGYGFEPAAVGDQ
jgi:ABC-type molybdate transport system substrate-binding protein